MWESEDLSMSEITSDSTFFEIVLESGKTGIRTKEMIEYKNGTDNGFYDDDNDCKNGFKDYREWKQF